MTSWWCFNLRIPSCPLKSPQPLKEFVVNCQTMPSRVKKSFCGCLQANFYLQDDEPPEITYCVVEQTGTLTLQAMTPTLPMPAEEELNKMFLELVDELDLTQANRQAVLALPANKKWQIYCSRKGNDTLDNGGLRTTDLSGDPEDYINRIKVIADATFNEDNEELSNHMRQVEALKTALRTQPHSFVLRFIELDGLNALLKVLGTIDVEAAHSYLHTSVIGCLKALMNNSNGRAHVLAHPTAINTISQSLATENIKAKISVLEILGAVCLVPGGHRKVLEGMLHFQQYHYERARFQSIINDLDKNFGIYKDNLSLKTAIMSFINAVLNYGPGQVTLEFRLHLRYELLMLGIQPIIEKLRKYENETLDRHLDFFEMVRNEDEKELARKFEKEHVDTKSATAMFDLLRRKLSHTPAYCHLLSLLEHCLLLPLDYGSYPQHWLLFDRIVQQIVLQTDNNNEITRNPDVAPININVKEIIHLLAKEEELVAARKRTDELERENTDMSTKLSKKEQELDLRSQEKEDIEASLMRIKERLEKETSMHIETKQKISEFQDTIETLSRQINNEKSERKRLEKLVASGSLPDDAKATIKIVDDELMDNVKSSSSPPPPPPPPPPPIAPPPPPPLLSSSSSSLIPSAPQPKEVFKNVPQPSNPLKSFNWSKIPEQKLQGTIWSELDDTKIYNVMDLETIDKIFCAYQKNGGTIPTEGSIEDLRNLGKNKKTMSVIDARRAQNCTILLSKLKMSDNEITRTIISMDQQNILHIDMVEQLLKYIPSSEEAALLDMNQKELQSRADCFLYQISKVPHYEQRLRSLHYKKKFSASISELTPRMRAVLEASRQVARSRRLRKLLELVLALGNYVNRGNARGNAYGFRLASLNRLVDTKSSCSKGTTLLHYLVQILESRFRDVLEIEEDMPHVRTAARVSMADLQKEVANLKNGLQDVQREIEFHRGQVQVLQGDMFLPSMRDFQAQATCRLAEAEDLFQDMKTRFDRAVRLFGEDSAGVQPDEFFGIFENFLQAFAEARQDVENMRRKIEEDERRVKQEQELKKRTMERKNSREGLLNNISISKKNEVNGNNGQVDNKGEFDDLISALRTGDVFGEDIAKFKRSKRRPVTPSGAQDPRRHNVNREDSRERH
ncbi:disheveled-associated activator of morphogenesis 1 isoform X2 [Aphidius gifuensis]|uniref:disheveled-associated activator of morphogenesis 1 isoform X2 n=1 Tax=Aphidius gifuensis TaxID=684658 RepID=UPI001CDC981B|nr:disheveled-associated activator of morphogenesis 1 isoform X2 [Aphidius gifuensis]